MDTRFVTLSTSEFLLKTKNSPQTCSSCIKEDRFHDQIQQDIKNLQETHNLMLKIAKECDPDNINLDITSQELGLNIPELKLSEGELAYQQAEILRLLLLGLNEKLKVLQIFKLRLIDFHNQLRISLEAHEVLSLTIEDARTEFNSKIKETEDFFSDLKNENKHLQRDVKNLREKLGEMEVTNEKLECENQRLKGALQVKKDEELDFVEMSNMVEKLQNQIKEANFKRDDLRKEFIKSSKNAEINEIKLDQQLQDVMLETRSLSQNLAQSQIIINTQNSLIEDLTNKNRSLTSSNTSLLSETLKLKNIESKACQMEELAKKHQNSCQTLHQKIFDITNSFQSETKYAKQDKENLIAHNKSLQTANSELENELIRYKNILEQANKEKLDLISQQAALEEHLCIQEDKNQIRDELDKMHELHYEVNQQIYNDLEFVTGKLVDESANNLQNTRVSARLKGMLDDRDSEISILREMVRDLQNHRTVYVPVKDDPVDAAIADYVNTRNVDVPFVREDLGIYLFGSKRVFIKLENGKIIIRVGGGYMKIDEFVELYTPLELEKFESRSKEEASSQRNSLLGKLAGNVVNEKTKGRYEISPQKAAQILKDAFASGNTKYSTCIALPRKPSPRHQTQPKPGSSSPSRLKTQRSNAEFDKIDP